MVEAHVDMMRALRADSRQLPWYGRLFRDYDNKPFQLGQVFYDTEQLRVKGVTVADFLLTGMSWNHFYEMGYRIKDIKQLDGTLDDIRAMGVRIHHLTDEFEHVTSEFVSEILSDKRELLQWTPAELFKMGFTMDSLLRLGCGAEMIPLEEMRYFFSPTKAQEMHWVAKVPVQPVVDRAVGYTEPRDVRGLSQIQIDVSRLV